MKKIRIAVLVFVLLNSMSANAQMPDSLRACLDSALVKAQTFALLRNTVNWEEVEAQIYWRAGLAQDVFELRPIFAYLLEQLHDTNGRFFFNNQLISWYHGEPKPYQAHIDPKVWGVIQSGKYPFQSAMLPDRTGYLRIPGIPQGDNAQLADPIYSAVCSLQNEGAKRWIIDLRYNGGGNMFAMLAGIANILGDGEVGGAVDIDGNRYNTWTIKEGDVYYNGEILADMENLCPIPDTPKVAVLLSRYTVSAGEVVAVAFQGRPNTRFFGEHTGGFTTSTSWVALPAGVTMSISTSYFTDRTGIMYKDFVPADEEIEFVPDAEPEKDQAIQMALKWLRK